MIVSQTSLAAAVSASVREVIEGRQHAVPLPRHDAERAQRTAPQARNRPVQSPVIDEAGRPVAERPAAPARQSAPTFVPRPPTAAFVAQYLSQNSAPESAPRPQTPSEAAAKAYGRAQNLAPHAARSATGVVILDRFTGVDVTI